MKRKFIFLFLILGVILVVGVFGYLAQNNWGVSTTGETKEFSMKMGQFYFDPSTLEVNEGDRVLIEVENLDVEHGIAIPVFGVSEYLSPGETKTIEFIASKKGEFSFFCNVYCGSGHREMKGVLIVR